MNVVKWIELAATCTTKKTGEVDTLGLIPKLVYIFPTPGDFMICTEMFVSGVLTGIKIWEAIRRLSHMARIWVRTVCFGVGAGAAAPTTAALLTAAVTPPFPTAAIKAAFVCS